MKKLLPLALICTTLAAQAQFTFQTPVKNKTKVSHRQNVVPLTAAIAYQGYDEGQAYFGQGEYEVFLDNVTGVLNKPIIVLDGFDPGDLRDINGLYNSLNFNGENLGDQLRDQGFDVVVLNSPQYTTNGKDIDGGADYIQRNAMVLVELIAQINAQKTGDEELVVLGPSMGGLVARYALAYMEQNGLEHETRLYISFDAPHKGANIPISLQYLINYLARSVNNDQAQAIVDEVLNSPAAKEMLYDHVLGHLLAGSDYEQDPTKLLPFGAPNFRDAFMAELATLNFPQDTRNVAVINGSGAGTTVGTPGTEVVNTTLNLAAGVTADAILHFTPAAAQNINVTSFETFVAGFPVGFFEAAAQALPTIDGVDAAPGGISFISNALGGAGGNQVIIDFINALNQDEFCFIPTMSALALQNEEDWYAIPDIGGVHTSPFDAVFIPTDNEPHTFVTKANAQFMLDEIDDPLAVEEHFTQNNYTLAQNPVNDKITININPKNPNPQATFTVHTYLGQQVIRTTALLQGKNQWVLDHSLSAGMYFLNIADADGNVTFKLLVK